MNLQREREGETERETERQREEYFCKKNSF